MRVNLPMDTEDEQLLKGFGFRWCTKDNRWEKNGEIQQHIISSLKTCSIEVETSEDDSTY